MTINDIFENRSERVTRLTASWPPDKLKRHSKALCDYTDGLITFGELNQAINAQAQRPASPANVVWEGDAGDAQKWELQKWREGAE